MSNELLIELKTPITVSSGKGDEIEMTLISLDPPTGKIAHLCANIKSAFFTSVSKLPADKESTASGDIDIQGKDMIQMMYMSGIDMEKVIVTAKEIIKAVGLIGGEKVINQTIVDRMDPDDIENCLGEYMANFILRSALLEMNAD